MNHTANGFAKVMWGGGWYGRLLLICVVALIPGAVIIAIATDPFYIIVWVNGLTAIMLLGRCVWMVERRNDPS